MPAWMLPLAKLSLLLLILRNASGMTRGVLEEVEEEEARRGGGGGGGASTSCSWPSTALPICPSSSPALPGIVPPPALLSTCARAWSGGSRSSAAAVGRAGGCCGSVGLVLLLLEGEGGFSWSVSSSSIWTGGWLCCACGKWWRMWVRCLWLSWNVP